jgi:hypothetical protein
VGRCGNVNRGASNKECHRQRGTRLCSCPAQVIGDVEVHSRALAWTCRVGGRLQCRHYYSRSLRCRPKKGSQTTLSRDTASCNVVGDVTPESPSLFKDSGLSIPNRVGEEGRLWTRRSLTASFRQRISELVNASSTTMIMSKLVLPVFLSGLLSTRVRHVEERVCWGRETEADEKYVTLCVDRSRLGSIESGARHQGIDSPQRGAHSSTRKGRKSPW